MESKVFDIVALGESLIDMVQRDKLTDHFSFDGNAGGAPANVLASAVKFGAKCSFIGKVGDDAFGRFLRDFYVGCGIDVSGMILSKDYPTTLAFVTLDGCGDRSFSFYRNETADALLRADEVDASLLESCRIFHFGSVSMAAPVAAEATLYAAGKAKEAGALISFDPNYREPLWPSEKKAAEAIDNACRMADIIKLSDYELYLLAGNDTEEAAVELMSRNGCKLLVVTLGKDGAFAVTKDGTVIKKPAYNVRTVDTTGAGDAFWGAFLSELISSGCSPESLPLETLSGLLVTANASGSISTESYGAVASMPDKKTVSEFLQAQK